jgi:AraC-like DNA-binding protein
VIAVEIRSSRTYGRHTHDEFGIGVMLDGVQDSASGRGLVRAGPGQVITVNPGEVHNGLPLRGAPRRWRMLYFRPDVLAGAFAGLGASTSAELAYPVLDHPVAARAYLDLHAALSGTQESVLAVESLLIEIVSHLVETGRPTPTPPPFAVAPARRLIDADPGSEVRLDKLATLCGLSRFHFLRSFRAAFGLPPHAYQVQRRLHLARRMILDGTTLVEAAAEAGFADQSHLTRHFLRAYGYTPGVLARA